MLIAIIHVTDTVPVAVDVQDLHAPIAACPGNPEHAVMRALVELGFRPLGMLSLTDTSAADIEVPVQWTAAGWSRHCCASAEGRRAA